MNALIRFFSLGMQDADRRVAARLTPPATAATDRYLWTSGLVSALDRWLSRLQEWSTTSELQRLFQDVASDFEHHGWRERYQSGAVFVLVAVAVHVSLVLAQGPRPGWFWLVIPAMASVFALLVPAGTRHAQR